MVGITKLDGITLEELKRPRRVITPPKVVEEVVATQEPQSGSTTTAPSQP